MKTQITAALTLFAATLTTGMLAQRSAPLTLVFNVTVDVGLLVKLRGPTSILLTPTSSLAPAGKASTTCTLPKPTSPGSSRTPTEASSTTT
jgi:hypothetical protein